MIGLFLYILKGSKLMNYNFSKNFVIHRKSIFCRLQYSI